MPVQGLQTWEQGRYLQVDDNVLLALANQQGLTLVTYDLRTIPRLLAYLAEQACDHAGVIFIDQKTIPPNHYGLLVNSLFSLWQMEKDRDWRNRVLFLEATND